MSRVTKGNNPPALAEHQGHLKVPEIVPAVEKLEEGKGGAGPFSASDISIFTPQSAKQDRFTRPALSNVTPSRSRRALFRAGPFPKRPGSPDDRITR